MRVSAFALASVGMLGCSSLLGLDDFKDGTGGAGGSAASTTGGTAGSGGSQTGGAPSGGTAGSGGAAAGAGGTGATGGTQPTGGAGGTGATGGTQPTGGAGGTGGSKPFTCTTGQPFTILDKAAIPDEVTNIVLASDDATPKTIVHVLLGHNFAGTPPSGRFAHELIAVRIVDPGAAVSTWSVWDMQASFMPGTAVVHTGGSPQTRVYGDRGAVERWTIGLDSSLGYQPGVNPVLLTMLGGSNCNSGFGTVEASAFSVKGNDERWAASCVGNSMRELWAGTLGQKFLVHTVGDNDKSLTPRVYHSPPLAPPEWRILWVATDEFRRGDKEATMVQPPSALPLGTATSQKVVGMSPRNGGVVVFVSRVLTTGPSFATVQLMEPYMQIDLTNLKEVGGPMPPPESLRGGTSGSEVRALAGPTMGSGVSELRLVLYDASGNVLYNANVHSTSSSIQRASAVALPGGKVLAAWRQDGTIRGLFVTCQ